MRRWAEIFAVLGCLLFVSLWLSARAATAEKALCVLRHDLEERIERTRDYLDELDTGKRKPIPGISRADFVTSIQNQERTVGALENLDCG